MLERVKAFLRRYLPGYQILASLFWLSLPPIFYLIFRKGWRQRIKRNLFSKKAWKYLFSRGPRKVVENDLLSVLANVLHNYIQNYMQKMGYANRVGQATVLTLPGDALNKTQDWVRLEGDISAPYVKGARGNIRVLLLNSMGGSMGRLSKALIAHEGIEADCIINAYGPRRHLLYPHETNAFGVLTHKEWREYLNWAVKNYDIIQTTTFPMHDGLGSCYDWLTQTLGRRHIWRTTGFIHHYLLREDVLPLADYQRDLKTSLVPDPSRFKCKTFQFSKDHILIDPWPVFYSSPEKGAYLQGRDKVWLPSMRDPSEFRVLSAAELENGENRNAGEKEIKVYVPHHSAAVWKGLGSVIRCLEELRQEGYPLRIVTSENAGAVFPDLTVFQDSKNTAQKAASYPVPNHLMPALYQRVDFVIDQIVMGSYGNTGIEAMFCGKPVLGQKRYEDIADAPVWEIGRENPKEGIKRFLDHPEEWKDLGRRGREYALKVHSPKAVAKVAADMYRKILSE